MALTKMKDQKKGIMLRAMDWREGRTADLGSTERNRRLNVGFHKLRPTICLHRARAYTDVYRETEGEPPILRRAKAFAKTLDVMPAVILEDELIVGVPACKPRAITVKPELQVSWLLNDIDRIDTRDYDPFIASAEEKQEFKEIIAPYWKGRTLYDIWKKHCPDIAPKVIGTGFADCSNMVFALGFHICPPFDEIFKTGLEGYRKIAEEKLSKLDLSYPENLDKDHFYNAIIIVCDAIERYAKKHSAIASELAQKESNPTRRKELEEIAEICGRVPHNPARSFREALQSFWFMHSILHIEGTGPAISPGRFDQYMYPFFRKDMDEGRLTREQAQELIECLFIKLNNIMWLTDEVTSSAVSGYTMFQNLMLGGIDPLTGKDATNELSYICIDALLETRTMQPTLSCMLHSKSPEDLRMKIAELVSGGMGHPSIFNLDTVIKGCMMLGYSYEEALDCKIKGCSEPYGSGAMQYGLTVGGWTNFGTAVEFAFTNGIKRLEGQPGSGNRLGLETGDPLAFKTFDEFKEAVKKQISYQTKLAHTACIIAENIQRKLFPLPLQSMLTKDCLERGKDVLEGGARINVGPGLTCVGVADIADCLAAVKKLVYEDKKVTMDELCRALDSNFVGFEKLRNMLVNESPKYGNDIDYVDDLAVEMYDYWAAEVRSHRGPRGNVNTPSAIPASGNVGLTGGLPVGALPSGRIAQEPLADGISPAPGMDRSGITATIKSVVKLDHVKHSGIIYNLWLSGQSLESIDGRRKFMDIIRTYQELGGHHVQVNCVDKDVLRDAQKHPDKYPTLMVRVAGYSAYFIDLPKIAQDHIIDRLEYTI